MPIYEYHCEPCDHTFETLIRSESDIARCPSCGSIDVSKQLSVPAAAQTGRRRRAADQQRRRTIVRLWPAPVRGGDVRRHGVDRVGGFGGLQESCRHRGR